MRTTTPSASIPHVMMRTISASATLSSPSSISSDQKVGKDGGSCSVTEHGALTLRLIGRSRRRSVDQDSYRSLPGIDEVMSRLGAVDKPSDTVDALLEQYVWGSCDWILSDSQFVSFLEDDKSQPAVLQITGHPGSGKSVLASFLIQHLESLNHRTQFWFFRYNDHVQRSTRQCLLSLVFQIANQWPEYSSRLVSLGRDIDSIARSDVRSLWSKLLLTLMDKLSGSCEPLFWIVDAVDESDSPQTFLGLLGSFKAARIPLRMFIFLRPACGNVSHRKFVTLIFILRSNFPYPRPDCYEAFRSAQSFFTTIKGHSSIDVYPGG